MVDGLGDRDLNPLLLLLLLVRPLTAADIDLLLLVCRFNLEDDDLIE